MQNDDTRYRGNPDRDRAMQEIYNWSDYETEAEAAGKDLTFIPRFKGAVNQIKDEFPEVFKDAELSKLVADEDERLVAAGDRRPYLQRYRDVCNWVLSGNEVPTQGNATVSDELMDMARSVQMGTEEEAAAALGKIIQSRNAQQMPAEETDSDVIEKMRQS